MTQDRAKPFPFDEFEPRWQAAWADARAFRTPNPGDADFDPSKPKYYVLDMFPYPSGAGLHVGHPEGYTATDIIARHKRMLGFNVLHPMGWDAFGLPAEQYAIKTGRHPRETTEKNVDGFRGQLQRLGFSYDWSREINTTDPGYFKWTQWIFLQLYHSYVDPESGKARSVRELEEQGLSRDEIDARRLAYVSEAPVNWCPALGTVLANEEVIDGKSEVGGHPVERRPMRQWMLRITSYAQRLIDELDLVDWPEGIKLLQRNWIGRSEGAEVTFLVESAEESLTVFTTRPDTLFGATYMVVSPEHPLLEKLTTPENRAAVEAYQKQAAGKSDLERAELAKDKTGVFTGSQAINPVTGDRIPIWTADYVLMSYGTGAIMAVPGHDERDFEFARKFDLPILQVVSQTAEAAAEAPALFAEPGFAVNSGFLNGLPTVEAKAKMIDWLESERKGSRKVQFKLRDWLFSRQRYWGEPFPVIWQEGRHQALPEAELPLTPPELTDFRPTGTPEPPLSKAVEWTRYSDKAVRELNTMPQWAGSCWYYLRYCDARNDRRFVGKEAEAYWMKGGVDLYVGGTEHAVLHLLYARFWHKALHDLGHVSTPEPFHKLVNQGLILGEDGQKMSKSRGNVVNPDEVVCRYGADSLRLYEMFMGPLEQVKPWSMSGVEGVSRFLARVWRLGFDNADEVNWTISDKLSPVPCEDRDILKTLHETLRKVTLDIDRLAFNTAISQMMILTNALTQQKNRSLDVLRDFLVCLSPFAPHIAEEMWRSFQERWPEIFPAGFCSAQPWPKFREEYLVETEKEIVVQVNGKLRARFRAAVDASEAQILELAKGVDTVQAQLEGKTIRKVIYLPGKLLNLVVG